MANAVLCPGCGKNVPIPSEYDRRKIRCPHCGVICEVPEFSGKKASSLSKAQAPQPNNQAWVDDVLFKEEPVHCVSCGVNLFPSDTVLGGQLCAACRAQSKKPSRPAPEPIAVPEQPKEIAVQQLPAKEDEEDGKLYRFAEKLGPSCPRCLEEIVKDATSCRHCGHSWKPAAPPPPPTYEPYSREWESGLPLKKRIQSFLGFQAFFACVLVMAIYTDNVGLFVFTWIMASVMLLFLFGTYSRVNLTRTQKGRVTLTQTWRVLFYPRPTEVIRLSQYVGVATTKHIDRSLFNWFCFFFFLGLGIVPGLIWYYVALHREASLVHLTQAHGFRECLLYQGWGEEQAEEMVQALQDICGLHFEHN